MTTDLTSGSGRKTRKPRKPNRDAVAALNLATIDGIPVRDGRTKRQGSTVGGILKDDNTIQPKEYTTPMGQRGGETLTAKQESFAQHVAKGMTLSDAYRAAYDAEGMSDNAVWSEASKTGSNPKVTARIKALDIGLKPKTPHDPAQVKAKIIETLLSILKDDQAKHADRMKAAELLGRWGEVSLFEEHSTLRVETSTPSEAIEALKDKIAKLKAS